MKKRKAYLQSALVDALEFHFRRLLFRQVTGKHGLEVGADAGQHYFVSVDLDITHTQDNVAQFMILPQELEALQQLLRVRPFQTCKHIGLVLLVHLGNQGTSAREHSSHSLIKPGRLSAFCCQPPTELTLNSPNKNTCVNCMSGNKPEDPNTHRPVQHDATAVFGGNLRCVQGCFQSGCRYSPDLLLAVNWDAIASRGRRDFPTLLLPEEHRA